MITRPYQSHLLLVGGPKRQWEAPL